MPAGPKPRLGWTGDVILAGYPLVVVPGSYEVKEPDRFGGRQVVGSLSYSSYAPYEQASVATRWLAGFGLRRYSDEVDENVARAKILEAANADTRGGLIHCASSFTTETLPSSAAPVVWMGEYRTAGGTNRFVAVAGTKVYYRNADGTWTDTGLTLPAAARQGAVGVVGTNLAFGFGSATTAKYTNDLATLGNVVSASTGSLFMWAITVDRAVAYAAVSLSATTPNVVASSTDGVTYITATGTVTCGSTFSEITGLAPGGGVQTVFVAKETEIGLIDNNSIYRISIPLDTKLATNGRGMRWWMGRGDDEQRGPLMLVFPRDRSPAAYIPDTQGAGKMQSLSPWGKPNADPPTIKGIPNAFVGTARWLYYSITNTAGNTWIIAHDMQTSVAHAVWSRGAFACNALAISSMFSSIPYLFVGHGNDVARTQLPFDGDLVLDNETANSIPLGTTCTVDFPYDDGGLADEDKVAASVRVISRNAVAVNRTITVYYDIEESRSYRLLGTATVSPHQELVFPAGVTRTFKRLGLRVVLTSSSATNTPVLVALGLRYFPTPKLYRYYSFAAMLPAGSTPLGSDSTQNAKRVMDDLWSIRMSGTPTEFYDRWGDFHAARIIQLGEKDVKDERERVPETQFPVLLLETLPGSAAPETETTAWLAPAAAGAMLPLALPWNPVTYGSYATAAKTVTNPGSLDQYPTWKIYGQMSYVSLVNTTTGKTLTLENISIPPGMVITIDTTPGRQTIFREDGSDASGYLASGYTFWPLAPGDNVITVTQAGTHDGARVELLRGIV
jgi:hypothetical protein